MGFLNYSKKGKKSLYIQKIFMLSLLLCLFLTLTSFSVAEDSYPSKIYLLEGDTIELSSSSGSTLYSGNPRVIELDGKKAVAKEAGTSVIYLEGNGQYNKLCEIIVFNDKLEVLQLTDAGNFSTVPYINATTLKTNIDRAVAAEFVGTLPFSSYDVIILGSGASTNWVDPMPSAIWDGNESGSLLLAIGSGTPEALIPDYMDFIFSSEYLGNYGHSNMTFAEEFNDAFNSVSIPAGTIPTDTALIQRGEAITPILAKHALWKMIYKTETSSVSSSVLEDAKAVLENPTSSPRDYILETHKLKKELSENVRISKVILAESDVKMKLGSQKELNATVLTSIGIASGVNVTWESDNESVAVVDEYGTVTAVGEGTAQISANIDSKLPAVCNVTAGKYVDVFLVNNGTFYSDSAVLQDYSNLSLFQTPSNRNLLYNDLNQYDIVFTTGSTANAGYYSPLYLQSLNNGSAVVQLNSSRITPALLKNSLMGTGSVSANRSHIAVGTNNTTSPIAGVYYLSNSAPIDSTFATYLQAFNLNTNQEKLEDFILRGEIEKEALKVFIDKQSHLDSNDYTAENWTAFSDKYSDAEAMLTSPDATAVEMAAMLYDLKEIYYDLEYVDPGNVSAVTLPGDVTMNVNSTIKMNVDVSGDNLKVFGVVWSSDNPSVASVNDFGVIRAHSPGKANISATSALDDSKSAAVEVNVIMPAQSIFLSDANLSLIVGGDSVQLTGVTHPLGASSGEIIWSSSNESVVTISSNGLVTPTAAADNAGKAVITAQVTFDENIYNSTTGTIEVKQTTITAQADVTVKVAPEDRIRILFVGENELTGAQMAADDMYYCGYFDYDYVYSYNAESHTVTEELLAAAENFSAYDVVFFDMFGEYETISDSLKKGKDAGTVFVSLESNAEPPDYFVSFSSTEAQKNSTLYKYYKQMLINNNVSTASALWGEKFLLEAAKKHAPEDKLPSELKAEKPLNVLYVGKDASNFSDTVKKFNAGVYGDAANWSILPYNETSGQFEELFGYKTNATTDGLEEWERAQIDSINNHLKENHYDIILFDGIEGESYLVRDPETGRPATVLYTHMNYLDEIEKAAKSNPATNVVLIGKTSLLWQPANLPFVADSGNQSLLLTFGLGDEDQKASNEYLFGLVQDYGHNRVKSWTYTDNSGAAGDAGYFHPSSGASRVLFSDLDTYITWATKNGYFDPERPTVGIWMFSSDIGQGTDALIYALEKEGVNVIAGYETFDEIPSYYTWTDSEGQTKQIDTAISIKNFGLNYWDYEEGVRQLEEMNIPVLKGFFATVSKDKMTNISDVNNMVDATNGARMTLSPNRDGIFEFTYLGYMDNGPVGVQAQIDWMAERAAAWAFLNQKENSQKDIAILYYNYPPGKADIGANYLNVMRSFSGTDSYPGILRTMNDSYLDPATGQELGNYDVNFTRLPVATPLKDGSGGYSFEYYDGGGEAAWRDKVMTEDNVMYLMLSQGINVGSHAPGVLDGMVQEYITFLKNGGSHEDWWGCQLLPVSVYKEWFDETEISDDLREELIDTWGEPWDTSVELPKDQSGMIWEDKDGYFGSAGERYFVFSAVRMGHVWILPQPDRALASSQALNASISSTDYHGDMAPTHQYVAFYFWMNRGMEANSEYDFIAQDWKPDAVVHFGTHGTQEWLPGTAIGMQQGIDWSPILLGRLPNIYPYIVANVGEGLTAEYRGNALIIDHLTPAMIRSGLYGELADLDSEIQSFIKQASMGNMNTSLSYEYRLNIIDMIYSSGVHEALDLSVYEKQVSGTVTDEKVKNILLNTTLVSDTEFSNLLKNQVHNYLDSVMGNALPYGMHVYGQSPDDNRTAYMVRAMWGNYRFEELIRSVYFKDLPEGLTIPYEPVSDGGGGYYYDGKSDSDVQNFTTMYVNGADIQDALKATLGDATPAELESIELFIRGPVKYYEDSSLTGDELKAQLKADWRSCNVDDVIIEELCTDFVPASVATDGRFNQTKFNTAFEKFVDEFVDNMDNGTDAAAAIDAALTKAFNINGYTTQTWINQPVIDYATAYQRHSFAPNLQSCGDGEMHALLNALSAGYIPPTTGNDPIQNPGILPTGRNFYGIDPNTYPTRAAWEVGQAMGEQMLADYYEKHGEFPKMVSFTRFGVEFIRDEGALEACIYYLLGCEPTWSGNQYTGTGTFTGAYPVTDKNHDMFKVTLSNGTVVERPRVDIIYTTAGMRDSYPSAIRYIDKAIRAVYALENDPIENNIQKNTNSIKAALKASNPELSDEQIEQLALARTFAQELGTYEIGTGNLVSSSGSWDSDSEQAQKDIVDLYLSKMGYIYNDEMWGSAGSEAMNKAMSEVLKQLLMRADASMFASSSNLYDTLDNDDVYQYFGIMNMVSQYYGGKLPEMYMADTSNVANYRPGDKLVTTMQEAIKKDLDSRYLNPEWIQGMMESGYSGSSMMAEFIENLFGWSVATNGELVSDQVWSQIMETYITSGILEGDDKYVYSYQSMTGRMIEAIRNGYWDATDSQQKELLEAYVNSVLEAGVACCHHTCGNPALDQFIAGQMSVLGLTAEEQEKYWEIVKQATERDKPSIKVDDNKNQSSSSGGGFGSATVVESGESSGGESAEDGEESDEGGQNPGVGLDGTETGTPTAEVSGFEMTVTNVAHSVREFIQNPTFSTSSMIAIAFVILAVGAVFYGTRRRNL